MANKSDYTDVSAVAISDEKRERLHAAQTECCVMWTNRHGWPVGVMHRFVWHDQEFWDPRLAKRSRNITEPPDGWEMEYL